MRPSVRPAVSCVLALAMGTTVLAWTATAASAEVTDSPVFLNEIHYDNAGTDAGEAIEVAGPLGTDLTGWSVVLYNGANGAAYTTTPLSGVLGESRVSVVTYPVNGIQNGSPDGVALVDPVGTIVEFLSYEGTFAAVGGPAGGLTSTDIGVAEAGSEPAGQSLQRVGDGDSAFDFTFTGPAAASFGTLNTGQTLDGAGGEDPEDPPVDPGECGGPTTPIAQIQGSGAATPLLGQIVTTEGVVVGDFQGGGDRGDLGGFFVQDPVGDGDPATSDGVFVFDPDAPALAPGDLVRVTGTADEFFEQTQVDDVSALTVCESGGALPDPTPVPLPTAHRSDLERFEGMLTGYDTLAVTENRNADDFGELRLSTLPPLVEPTEVADGGAAAQLAQDNLARQIILDDARNGENLSPVAYVTSGGTIRRGDTVSGLTGILGFGFGAYRVQPTEDVAFVTANPRPGAPGAVGGDLQVASFNVLNYFTTLGSRGAVTPEEFDRQEAKIVAAIAALDAEVVALQEIENNAGLATQTLVDALNAADAGSAVWAAVPNPAGYGTGFGTTDQITNALIYRTAAVTLVDDAATVLIDEAFDNARAPYAATFTAGRSSFTVISNHFKSKSCGGATGANLEEFPGAGCFNADRVLQAQALAGFVADLAAVTPDVFVLGDLNSYTREDPIDVLTGAGLVDQLAGLDAGDRYTFVFDGEQGVLDHTFSTAAAADSVTGVDIWHINADEPDAFEYTGPFFAPDPFRASDHDPVLIGLDIDTRPGGGPPPGVPGPPDGAGPPDGGGPPDGAGPPEGAGPPDGRGPNG